VILEVHRLRACTIRLKRRSKNTGTLFAHRVFATY
jgi:hypothetical protein